jgi:hypothetical protein
MNQKHSLLRWWGYVLRHGWPKRIFYFFGGLGDQLLCTGVGRELQKRGAARGAWWFTEYAQAFRNCPDLRPLIPKDDGLMRWAQKYGVPIVKLAYEEHDRDLVASPAREHLIAALCREAGITGQVDLRPYWPHDSTTDSANRARPRVAIHSSCLNARFPMPNKQWPVERLQQLVGVLAHEVDFIQVGDSRDPLLPGVEDRRGCDIATAADILCEADLFVGMVGFLMHLARAVDCPAVIVYGGREPAAISGYSCNANLESRPSCSPCWQNEKCEHNRECLSAITVGDVVGEVRCMLASLPSRPLVCDSYSIN